MVQHFPMAALVGTDPLDLPGLAQPVQAVPDGGSGGAEGGGYLAAAGGRVLPQEGQDAVPDFLAVFWLIQIFWLFSG